MEAESFIGFRPNYYSHFALVNIFLNSLFIPVFRARDDVDPIIDCFSI